MKGNFVAKHMNTINRSSVHKDLRKEFAEDHKTHIQEGLRGCTPEMLYIDDGWYDPVMTPFSSSGECSNITPEQIESFKSFNKDLIKTHPVTFFTATHIDRKET